MALARRLAALLAALLLAAGVAAAPAWAHDVGGWTNFTGGGYGQPCTYSNAGIANHADFVAVAGSAINGESPCGQPRGEWAGRIVSRVEAWRYDTDHWTLVYGTDGWITNGDGTYQAVASWHSASLTPAWYLARAWSFVWHCAEPENPAACDADGYWQGGHTDSPSHWLG